MKNVVLDTHIYVFAMENFVPIPQPWVYKLFINYQKGLIARAQKYTPVIVGEWCICNKYAEKADGAERRARYREIASMQLNAWETAAGHIYWNYQLLRDRTKEPDERWKESWDLARCWINDWIPLPKKEG